MGDAVNTHFLGQEPPICSTPCTSIYEVTRAQEIDQTIGRIIDIGLSWTERRAIIQLLCDRQTHRQIAEADGIKRKSSCQRINRARRRAKAHGIEIPCPRGKNVRKSLAEFRLRA